MSFAVNVASSSRSNCMVLAKKFSLRLCRSSPTARWRELRVKAHCTPNQPTDVQTRRSGERSGTSRGVDYARARALLAEAAQKLELKQWVEMCKRFIGKHHARAVKEDARETHPLLLSRGERSTPILHRTI
mmetsp:Transcript_106/g.275  ORF Transcript_106/g.275 Transcript_106/m.275 type:complete len:131 (+) Transcript_106:626-1018(+)